MIKEIRATLLEPKYFFQFFIHLCNQKNLQRLCEAEWYDLMCRLQEGPSYDPRADRKHLVYGTLKLLEEQRPAQLDPSRKRRKETSQEPSLDGDPGDDNSNLSLPTRAKRFRAEPSPDMLRKDADGTEQVGLLPVNRNFAFARLRRCAPRPRCRPTPRRPRSCSPSRRTWCPRASSRTWKPATRSRPSAASAPSGTSSGTGSVRTWSGGEHSHGRARIVLFVL